MKYLYLMALATLLACNGPSNEKAESDTTVVRQDAGTPYNISYLHKDSIIMLKVAAQDLPDSIVQTIAHSYQQLHLVIENVSTPKLEASLIADGTGRNIRFNQLIMPDSTMDGPFGRSISYATKQKGTYTLIIAKDNMADGKVEGRVTIKLNCK